MSAAATKPPNHATGSPSSTKPPSFAQSPCGLDQVIADKYAGQTRVKAGIEMPASTKYLGDFQTAAEYQMTHALGLILIGVCLARTPCKTLTAAAWLLLCGTLVFSGSLYLLVLTGARWLGAITPLGGTAMILGWAIFAWSFTRTPATRC